MLRRSVFLFCVALLVALATSSKAQAWGCYRAAGVYGGYGGYRAGAVGGYRYGGAAYGGYGGYRAGYVRRW
ncbi:MAG TPA: hypothetical protein VH643_31820 [Gemmataceae bacterium]